MTKELDLTTKERVSQVLADSGKFEYYPKGDSSCDNCGAINSESYNDYEERGCWECNTRTEHTDYPWLTIPQANLILMGFDYQIIWENLNEEYQLVSNLTLSDTRKDQFYECEHIVDFEGIPQEEIELAYNAAIAQLTLTQPDKMDKVLQGVSDA